MSKRRAIRTRILWGFVGGVIGVLISLLAARFLGNVTINPEGWSTAATALGGILLGAWLARDTEHDKWLRDERLRWLGEFVETSYLLTLPHDAERHAEALQRAIAAMARVEVLASVEVSQLSAALNSSALAYGHARTQYEDHDPELARLHREFFNNWHRFVGWVRDELGIQGAPGWIERKDEGKKRPPNLAPPSPPEAPQG